MLRSSPAPSRLALSRSANPVPKKPGWPVPVKLKGKTATKSGEIGVAGADRLPHHTPASTSRVSPTPIRRRVRRFRPDASGAPGRVSTAELAAAGSVSRPPGFECRVEEPAAALFETGVVPGVGLMRFAGLTGGDPA